MSSDDGLWPEIRKHIRDVDWQRIETGIIAAGVPDLNGCMESVEAWIELKATDTFSVNNISPHQIGWLEKRARNGGRTFLLTRRRHNGGPRKGLAVDEIWLHRGVDARHVLVDGLKDSVPPLLVCSGGPAKWNWELLKIIIFKRPIEAG